MEMAIQTGHMTYIIILLTGFIAPHVKSTDPIVQTDCGKIAGKSFKVTADDGRLTTVHEFVNIPYAIPPKGKLRWRAPVDLKEGGGCWKGIREYDDTRIKCAQYFFSSHIGDEDCLVLTVNTPMVKSTKPLPVVVWIHGGGMTLGDHRMKGYYPDAQFTASMNVVSVSINYRLNYFGFLSLEELWEDKPTGGFGNYGIMDQILALKWVQKNIRNFGGDPNQVTVFGESGGGTAAYALIAASTGLAKGLFQKIIPMSGLSNFRTTHTKANEIFRPVLNKTGCVRDTKREAGECLRSLDKNIVQELSHYMPMTSGYSFEFPFNEPFPNFVPIEVVDPLVVKYSLEKFVTHLQSSPYKPKIDILMGCTAQETLVPWGTQPLPRWDSWKVLQNALKPKFDSFKKGSYHGILKTYREQSSRKISPQVIDPFYVYTIMISDVRVGCTTARKAKLLSNYRPFRVASYVVSQPPESLPDMMRSASHGSDSLALFGFKFEVGIEHHPTANDKKLQNNIRNVFRKFFHSDSMFHRMYQKKTIEFWNNTIVTHSHPYREEECKLLRNIGLSRQAWGNLGIYND